MSSDDEVVVEIDARLKEIVPIFFSELEEDLEEMEDRVEAVDFERVRQIAHDIKGNGGGYGFDRMSELAASLEEAARDENLEEVERRSEELEKLVANLTIRYSD